MPRSPTVQSTLLGHVQLTWLSPCTVDRSSTARVLLNNTLCVPIRALNTLYRMGRAAVRMGVASGPFALHVRRRRAGQDCHAVQPAGQLQLQACTHGSVRLSALLKPGGHRWRPVLTVSTLCRMLRV